MRTPKHLFFGVFLGAILSFFLIKLGYENIEYLMMLICVTSVLPDILEPATNYKHRKFFHGKGVLKLLAYTLGVSFIIALLFSSLFFYISFGALGYVSHLLLDGTTPMGLPG